MSHLHSERYAPAVYWHSEIDPPPTVLSEPPSQADVLIVGAGYTGLNASIETIRAGLSTVIVDSDDISSGCSSRNGGQISTSIKPSLETLRRHYDESTARAIRQEGDNALEWIEQRIHDEELDCDFLRAGRYHAAHCKRSFGKLAAEIEHRRQTEQLDAHIISPDEQRNELGTDYYHGGVVYPGVASLHPGKYHRALLRRTLQLGTQVVGNCAASGYSKTNSGFEVITRHGTIQCRQLLIASNGYTEQWLPWLTQRIIPVGSYIIATEHIDPDLMDTLFPTRRVITDSRRVVYYYRPSPDRKRIVFGGRVSATETNPDLSGPLLHRQMCQIFPELQSVKIDFSWMGTVAYSFDHLPHTGQFDDVHFSLGYCGSGVSLSSYLGMKLGQRVAGTGGETVFDGLPFPTRPLYQGNPWFLPAAVTWYRLQDGLERLLS